MAKNNSMIDNDFLDGDEDDFSANQDLDKHDKPDRFSHESEVDLEPPPADKAKEDELQIDIVSDVPDADRGKRVAEDDESLDNLPSEDEAKTYSKKVQRRLKELTEKTHAERRRADDLKRQLDEAVNFAKQQAQRSNQLSEVLETGEKTLVGEHKGRLDAQLAAAKQAYRAAHEAGDIDGQLAAQENMAKTVSALDNLSRHQPRPIPRVSEDYQPRQEEVVPVVDERARGWQEKNRWFGRDEGMTMYAMAMHKKLTTEEGLRPDENAYWKRIDGEMQKRFPERFESAAPRRTTPIVGAASRSGGGDVKRVTLTESQVKLAKRFGLTVEQYAKQVIKDKVQDQ